MTASTARTARPSKVVPRACERGAVIPSFIVDNPPVVRVSKPRSQGKPKTGTVATKSHIELILSLPCALCVRLGRLQAGRTYAHHVRTGQGKSQRASDYLAIPLCYDCHQGVQGVHGDRTMLRIAKCEEIDLLADVIQTLSTARK